MSGRSEDDLRAAFAAKATEAPAASDVARAVKDLSTMLDATKQHSPLRHVTEAGEVGDAAAFLASDLSRGVTGNILFVDSGMQLL